MVIDLYSRRVIGWSMQGRQRDRWRKHRNVICDRHSVERLAGEPTPGKQLLRGQSMPSRHGADRHARLITLGNDLSLARVAPRAPSAAAGENLEPAHRLFIAGCKRKL
ncbi:transposase InsO family protein [Mycoplana sp. BE70]|nr:hypothetical protein [Mycoplana sp. BE70]MDR6759711.1 transposase InsO family protein [Mycoplana sp. BE70]